MILDRFQKEAIDYVNEGFSVIVSAPTGAGKTVIAEHVIQRCLDRREKVIYTAPIKALSNQKFREFQKDQGDRIGILTGDVTINPRAQVLIMTTEIFRNKILDEEGSLKDYAWIIFDEIHYLDDYERGSVWEESLIFFPEHMRLLGLSATIPNIEEFANWISTIHHRPVKIVREANRPVPLHIYFQCQGRIVDQISTLMKMGLTGRRDRDHRHKDESRLKPNLLSHLVEFLKDKDLLPCIYFAFSRKRTRYLAEELRGYNFLSDQERGEVKDIYGALCRRFDLMGEASAEELRPLIERGIACHHAGMLPTLKEVVEQLFTSRLVKIIFTTETFALGINMPARTVVFDELRKFYGRGFSLLKTRDFYQMAGRAGRRGIDEEGFVFCRINPHDLEAAQLHRMIFGEPEKVVSQFNASYATLLNLFLAYGEKLYDIYPQSFHYHQARKFRRREAVDFLRTKVSLLKTMGFIHQDKLTPKGEFARRIYGYELIVTELYDQGILERCSTVELGVLVLSIIFEPRKGMMKPPLSDHARNLERRMRQIKNQIHRIERDFGIEEKSKRCYFHLSAAMEAWIQGASFEGILKLTEVDEGEIVRYFRMTIQLLKEIGESPVSEELRVRIRNLVDLINRDVIDAEKQLRG